MRRRYTHGAISAVRWDADGRPPLPQNLEELVTTVNDAVEELREMLE